MFCEHSDSISGNDTCDTNGRARLTAETGTPVVTMLMRFFATPFVASRHITDVTASFATLTVYTTIRALLSTGDTRLRTGQWAVAVGTPLIALLRARRAHIRTRRCADVGALLKRATARLTARYMKETGGLSFGSQG